MQYNMTTSCCHSKENKTKDILSTIRKQTKCNVSFHGKKTARPQNSLYLQNVKSIF